jgi:hypothetical protein
MGETLVPIRTIKMSPEGNSRMPSDSYLAESEFQMLRILPP